MASQLARSPVGATSDKNNETLFGSVLNTFKIKRSRAKANVTRIVNNIKDMMLSKDNLKLVVEKTAKLDQALQTFIQVHEQYHSLLVRGCYPGDIDIDLSVEYRNSVIQKVDKAHDLVKTWTASVKRSIIQTLPRVSHDGSRLLDVRPQDSISNAGACKQNGSDTSHNSSASHSTSALRLKASAEAAALEAEAKSLQAQKELEFEQLKLEQRKKELELQKQLARARALEQTYASAEERHPQEKYVHSTPNYAHIPMTSHPAHITDESLLVQIMNDTKNQQQSLMDNLQLPKTEIMTFDGNPLKYWTFTRMFQNLVDKNSISDQSKLALLMQYTAGPAKKLIECCAVMTPETGYQRAKTLLRERFGDPFVIAEQWVTHITSRPDVTGSKSLQEYADDLQTCRETLASLNRLCELNTSRCLLQVIDKLPNDLRKRWAIKAHSIKADMGKLPSIDDVVEFVSTSAAQANDPVFGKLMQHKDKGKSKENRSNKPANQRANFTTQVNTPVGDNVRDTRPSTTVAVPPTPVVGNQTVQKYNGPCCYCGHNHNLFNCVGFKAMKPGERLSFVQNKHLCFNCLLPGHRSNKCLKNTVCTVPGCGQKHTKFLHLIPPRGTSQSVAQSSIPTSRPSNSGPPFDTRYGPPAQSEAQSLNPTAPPYIATSTSTSASVSCSFADVGKVVLPIVPVRVRGENMSSYVSTYALLDTGSTQTFCSEHLVSILGVPGQHETMQLTTLDNCSIKVDTQVLSLEIGDANDENHFVMSHVLTRPKLHISEQNIVNQSDLDKWPHLSGISLPDVDIREVHLLIGQDNPDLLTPHDVKAGAHGEPYATKTWLGWTLNGPLNKPVSSHVNSYFIEADTSIHQQVERLWKLDEIHDETCGMSVSDKAVISLWEQSLKHEGDHYCFDIPFKESPPQLPNNQSMAVHRLQLLGKRLNKDEQLKSKYALTIKDLVTKGYAEIVPDEELDRDDGRVWYLPHHPVFSERKPDKVRIVFDCAAKCQGTSLNDNVYQGPDLTNKLVGVLLRFRQEPIAMMADIEAMYHQVLVSASDRDALRFLWWENDEPGGRVIVYRMRAHLFGGVWSSSCANYALKRTATDHASEYSAETVNTVLQNFYVDDCLKSVADVSLAIETMTELRTLLSQGGFNLTKWVSNSREVLQSVPQSEWAKEVKTLDLDQDDLPIEHALGVLWNIEADCFGFNVIVKDKPLTKRGLLSMLASIYDPLGFVSPFVLAAKLLFQELCRLKTGWDDPMPHEIAGQWGRWRDDLPLLRGMLIPRCVKPPQFDEKVASIQLHHFSDASEGAYGVVSYARFTSLDGQVHCSFLVSKAKLAPLKVTTIPRLELAAATVSIQLDQMIQREMEIAFTESIYWTDSMIVLQYVYNEDKRFKTFVANRVSKIRAHSIPGQWRYIDSGSNPADDVTRGMSAKDLITDSRWIQGPPFLWRDASAWPEQPQLEARLALSDNPEVKKEQQVYIVQTESKENVIMTLLKRHSTWYSLKKAVAWILRLKAYLCGKTRTCGPLSVAEIAIAEKEIIRQVQRVSFPDIHSKSSAIRKLMPIMSQDNLLCVGGRLANANLNNATAHPWILPKSHPIVDMIIQSYHVVAGHTGVEHVLAEIRQKFWIVKGRSAVKRVIHKCIPCRRRKSPLLSQVMADLPKDRVTSESTAFGKVGIDFFGPFLVKRGRSEAKRYGCLFACLTTRAIHIEVCHSLTTSAFINALQRFISRRGKPNLVRSDNGTNLVGGEKELRMAIRDWNQNQITDFLRQKDIEWIFNTPTASHMGGAWERLIRSVRSVMISVMSQQSLDDEGLLTLLCLVEGIVNGRPLTKVSDDPRDPAALTPNHLLLLRPGPNLPPGLFDKDDVYRKHWRQVQYLANIFWRRWLKEYLPQLQQRQKWLSVKRDLQVGDLVLMRFENTPRCQWPLGLVTKTYPGSDGHVRSVQLLARNTIYERPVHKLCLLEGVEDRYDH